MSESTHVLVVGGSFAGLATALALSRRGIEVRLVDADPAAAPGLVAPGAECPGADPLSEEARRVPRRATPQAAHSHAFLARCRELLRVEAPDVLDDLRDAGARELALAERRPPTVPAHARHPDDDDLVVLAARRTTFEAVLRRAVRRRPEVRVEVGRRVDGLVVDRSGPVPRVRGVAFEGGATVSAHLVVDATGRRSPMPRWLAAAGVPVTDDTTECGIAYLSRFYRRAPDAPEPPLSRGYTAGGSLDRYSCLVFPGDAGTFSVTFGILPEDRSLRGLRDAAAFDAAVRAIPALAPWLDPEVTQAISDVRLMAGLTNSIRRTTEAGQPGLVGWAAVGDAAATTNPAHSRGCTLALLHATGVADAVAEHAPHAGAADVDALAEACAAVVERDQRPWVDDSIEQDRHRLARWRSVDGHWHPPHAVGRVCNGETYVASQHDAYVWRRFTRLQQLLDQPEEVLADRRVVARVRAVQASRPEFVTLDGPSRPEMIRLIAGVPDGYRVRWATT